MRLIAFRVDASLEIGAGHVMRCLTLADALHESGASCAFVCRPHQGHLLEIIAQRGHRVMALPKLQKFVEPMRNCAGHAHWLGTDLTTDAQDTQQALIALSGGQPVDWLVVDHYGLDARWEEALRPRAKRIMVIDDLADRPHACDLLLDQTFGREAAEYVQLAQEGCTLLCGSKYVLLRPEFAALKAYSLNRRQHPVLRELLVTMGGIDNENATQKILNALQNCTLPRNCRITVVMGQRAPWLQEIRTQAELMPRRTRVLSGVSNMAEIMADSDLAIGAAGGTSWERCCLGLPSIVIVLAQNQLKVAKELKQIGAAAIISLGSDTSSELKLLISSFVSNPSLLHSFSNTSSAIVDGTGVAHIVGCMES